MSRFPNGHYFHIKTNILADFQISVKVTLIVLFANLTKEKNRFKTISFLSMHRHVNLQDLLLYVVHLTNGHLL